MTPANIYQFLGCQEEAIGTLCIDEANSIDENTKLMEILKTGYISGNKVVRTDTHNGRVQNAYYTFCYKAFAGERLPDSVTANGFNERLIPIYCYDGNPKYDIAEIISPAGEQEYLQLFNRIEHTWNLLFIHRLINWFEPIPAVKTRLRGREKQLFGSLIRIYYNESIWTEIKFVIHHYILNRRTRQMETVHAYLFGLVNRLIIEKHSLQLKSSDIWNTLKSELDGKDIPSQPHSYSTDRYGVISQKKVTNILRENFGAEKPKHHGNANELVFDSDKLKRLKNTYEVSVEANVGIVGIDGDDGDDSKHGMDAFVQNDGLNKSSENLDETSNLSPNETVKTKDGSVNGTVGIDGDDSSQRSDVERLDTDDVRPDKTARPLEPHGDDGDIGIVNNKEDKERLESKTISNQSSANSDDIHFEMDKTDQSSTDTNNQIRRATATVSTTNPTNYISSHTKDLSHLSHLSHTSQQSIISLTKEKIAEFFDDDGLPYCTPPPHTLNESPCKPIIRIDKDHFYYCTLHPDVRNIYLETIEHEWRTPNS
jgi:hypothetical protein